MPENTLTTEEIEALQHRLAMYKNLSSIYPMEQRYLQRQIEVLLLLKEHDDAELLMGRLQSLLNSKGLEDEAKKAQNIRSYLNKEKHCNQLYSTPFLHLASSSFIEKAFRQHRRIELEEGDYLIRYGAQETQMFILVHGELAVWSRDDEGKKHFEHTMRAGEVIGELSFLDNTPRSADVIVCRKSMVLAIPRKAVLKLFLENPSIEQALRAEATARKIQMDIKKSKALSKLPKDVQGLLAKHGSYVRFSALERIHPNGHKIEAIDMVCDGYVRLVGELHDGSSLILNSLKPGVLLGCSATIPHMEKHYIADIVSMDDTTLIRFSLDFFKKTMDANPRLYQAVLHDAELEHGSLLQTIGRQNNE